MKQSTIFFDLDGTLTESGPGIIKSVRYALSKYGIEEPDDSALRRFIGPPLVYSFSTFYGFSKEEAVRAMSVYREYYGVHGIFDNSVYEGIPDLLAGLKAAGKRLCVATGKPEKYAVPILEHYGLASYFDVIGGSDEAETRADKTSVIRYVLEASGESSDNVVMVGDRHHDVDGAKANGIPCVGVLYGYGDRAELEKAGAEYIAESVTGLKNLLL
ncbi:MAG: HAD family hydrolase [Treponema sp.]|nr:HAD family hydrolase [Treponema sp.]